GHLTTADGEPWLDRTLGAAAIVAGLKVDASSVRAAILLGAPSVAGFDAAEFAERFGAEVAQMVIGAARMGAIRAAPDSAGKEERDLQAEKDRKSTRLNSSHVAISYAVFCLKKKKSISTDSE